MRGGFVERCRRVAHSILTLMLDFPEDKADSEAIDPSHVKQAFSEFDQRAQQAQDILIESSVALGNVRNRVRKIGDALSGVAERAVDEPDLRPPLASGLQFLGALGNEVGGIIVGGGSIAAGVGLISSSVSTFSGASAAIAGIGSACSVDQGSCLAANISETDIRTISEKFKKLSPALRAAYEQVWQSYHGTTADPLRGALPLMRHTFDHFFEILAPDDRVRKSVHWQRKTGDKPDQIHRRERIEYAANTHVRDPLRAETLAKSAANMLDIYDTLQAFHTRGPMDEISSRNALSAMNNFFKEWVDALQL